MRNSFAQKRSESVKIARNELKMLQNPPKMVEIARALCLKPQLLLLDEPSSGLNPEETEDLSFWIEDINEDLGTTLIMVEHDMNLVSIASDRVMVLTDGQLVTVGTPSDVRSHPEVLRAYLGD